MTALLDVENLTTRFHTRNGIVRAVEDVSFRVPQDHTLGVVGESGSGKSVTFLSLLGLLPCPPARIEGHAARFEDLDLLTCSPRQLRKLRGKGIAMIFQDPMTALNPYMKIGTQLMEPLLIHEKCRKAEARKRAIEALERVGLQDGALRMNAYPHEFSGGMRQRVMIAMALITKPKLLIADEPTTALDVTVQAQILELIRQLQEEEGTAVVLITHDLAVVAGVCDRVMVMYAGRIVEETSTCELFDAPRHPYSRALMDSMPSVHVKGEELCVIPGMPPDLSCEIQGCSFAPRCAFAQERCCETTPPLREVSPDHKSACIRAEELDLVSTGRKAEAL